MPQTAHRKTTKLAQGDIYTLFAIEETVNGLAAKCISVFEGLKLEPSVIIREARTAFVQVMKV